MAPKIQGLIDADPVPAFLAQQAGYKDHLRRFFAYAQLTTMAQVRALTKVKAYAALDAMRGELSVATMRATISVGRSFYRWLEERGHLAGANPLDEVKVRGKVEIPMWNVLQPGQEELLLNAISGQYALRDRAIILTLLEHGFRAHELCKLTNDKLSIVEDKHIVEFVGKGGKPARMRLKDSSFEAIQAWRAKLGRAAATVQLIPYSATRALTRHDIKAIVHRLATRAGLRVTPHGIRATYISKLVRTKGIDVAQKMARHASAVTTQRYNRWEVLDDEEVLDDSV